MNPTQMLKVQCGLDCNTILHKCVKSIRQSLNHFLYLLLCMIFPSSLVYDESQLETHDLNPVCVQGRILQVVFV